MSLEAQIVTFSCHTLAGLSRNQCCGPHCHFLEWTHICRIWVRPTFFSADFRRQNNRPRIRLTDNDKSKTLLLVFEVGRRAMVSLRAMDYIQCNSAFNVSTVRNCSVCAPHCSYLPRLYFTPRNTKKAVVKES